MNRILVIGATSMLGWNLVRNDRGHSLVPLCNVHTRYAATRGWTRLRLDDEPAIAAIFEHMAPTLLLYCDGICDVEKCERNPEWAREVNVNGLSRVLKHLPAGTRLVYCSSDHVFSGDGDGYDERTPPDPISVYGRTRVEAEQRVTDWGRNHLILRVSLGIGPSIDGRSGHLDWLKYRTIRGLPITIVEDEYRSVVWMEDLVARVLVLATSGITGLRHIAATRCVSRPDLAAFLNRRYRIGARFRLEGRHRRRAPHLGRVELKTRHRDPWARPLASVLD